MVSKFSVKIIATLILILFSKKLVLSYADIYLKTQICKIRIAYQYLIILRESKTTIEKYA